MAAIKLTAALRQHYQHLFNDCMIRPNRTPAVEDIIDKVVLNRSRYMAAGENTGIPWCFVAAVHNMESTLDFGRHLHNGDPLSERTVHVPAGRPRDGHPPFTWEHSAADALTWKRLGPQTDWSLAGTLYQLEKYNGWGYRRSHPEVLSPYLWSFSNHYRRGKYVADGRWSDTAVSRQCGAAVLLRRMVEKGLIDFSDQPAPHEGSEPLISHFAVKKPTAPHLVARAVDLQEWLNTFPGVFVKVDGWPGKRTSSGFKTVTGAYLPGDPRSS